MTKKFKNKTASPQQIMLCNGEGITVLPGEESLQKTEDIFPEEIKRCEHFFTIEDYEEPKPSSSRKAVFTETTEEKGGNE